MEGRGQWEVSGTPFPGCHLPLGCWAALWNLPGTVLLRNQVDGAGDVLDPGFSVSAETGVQRKPGITGCHSWLVPPPLSLPLCGQGD